MKKDTTTNNKELNGSTFISGKSKGLEALEENLEMVTFNNNEELSNYIANYYIIEKELKTKANLVSMCENLAKLVGLKEKDYVELETLITKKLKALEIIKKTAMKLVNLEDSESGICVNGRCAIYDNELYESIDITQEEYDLLKEILK